jgi:altronate dehydratase small subunit
MAKALKINPRDNCAVLLADARAGEQVEVRTEAGTIRLVARQDIALGHKIALARLDAGQPIVKYGEEIGQAGTAIEAGDWIHLHNVTCRRGHENQEA